MAVDFPAALPSWKLDLIERKRRQELDPAGPRVSSDLGSDAATLPPWKQEILFRKHQKSLTGTEGLEDEIRPSPTGIFLSPGDGKECGGAVGDQRDFSSSLEALRESPERGPGLCADGEIPLEDRLPPVHLNPIFLMDLENRVPPTVAIDANDSHRPVKQSGVLRDSGLRDIDADGTDDSTVKDLRCDEIQNEEEVTYGKGFVNRLLQKFSCLSGREEPSSLRSHFPRTFSRQQSDNDFFDDFYKSGSRSRGLQMTRTNSLDDLLREGAIHSEPENCHVAFNDAEGECGVRWSSNQGNESRVLSVKNIFEGLAKLPTSANNWALHSRHLTSPRLCEKSDVSDSARIRELQAENSEDFRDGVVQNCLDSSNVMQNKNFDTAAHHHAINDDMLNSYGCRASLPPPTENKLKTVTDIGVYLGEENNRNDKAAVQVSMCKTDVLAHLIDLPEKNNTNDRFVVGNSATSELMSSNLSAGLPQTRQEIGVQVSPNSLQDPNNSDQSEPVKFDTRAKNSPSSADPTAAKKPLPRPGLLLIRPASNLANVRSNGLEKMTKYNDIRDGEFLPAKITVKKSAPSGDSDPDEFEEPIDASKYLRTVRFEFEGAGICLERSLLSKSRKGAQV